MYVSFACLWIIYVMVCVAARWRTGFVIVLWRGSVIYDVWWCYVSMCDLWWYGGEVAQTKKEILVPGYRLPGILVCLCIHFPTPPHPSPPHPTPPQVAWWCDVRMCDLWWCGGVAVSWEVQHARPLHRVGGYVYIICLLSCLLLLGDPLDTRCTLDTRWTPTLP